MIVSIDRVQALAEMLHVAHEARVFPLLTLDGNKSVYLEPVIDIFRNRGLDIDVRRVCHEFHDGGNEALSTCDDQQSGSVIAPEAVRA